MSNNQRDQFDSPWRSPLESSEQEYAPVSDKKFGGIGRVVYGLIIVVSLILFFGLVFGINSVCQTWDQWSEEDRMDALTFLTMGACFFGMGIPTLATMLRYKNMGIDPARCMWMFIPGWNIWIICECLVTPRGMAAQHHRGDNYE